jgi:hypothetical protein
MVFPHEEGRSFMIDMRAIVASIALLLMLIGVAVRRQARARTFSGEH